MGGTSCEREISLMSGQNVLNALLRQNINAYPIDVDDNIIDQLHADKPDAVFIALHGTNGEDGIIQSLLGIMQIPYTGSGVAASALTMDKYRCNLLLKSAGFPILPAKLLNDCKGRPPCLPRFHACAGNDGNLCWCIKPTNSGSSRGISRITDIKQLPQAYNLAKQFGTEVMIEPWIIGREFTVGILENKPLPVIEVTPPQNHFYDYEAKYFSDKTSYKIPCDLTKSEQQHLQNLAYQAFQLTGCKVWGRVDFIQDKQGKFWILEINTVPGLTKHSLVPMAAKYIGIDFDELIMKILFSKKS